MRNFRKMISFMLTIAMVATMMISLAMAEGTPSIVVNSDDNHSYDVYQIFTANIDASGTLTEVALGENGVLPQGTTLEAALAELSAIESTASDSDKLAVITKYFDAGSTPYKTATKDAAATVETGYYLVNDASTDMKDADDAHTTFIVKVVNDAVTISRKDVKPSVDKQVLDETADAEDGSTNGWGESADHAINESFQFKLIATLPADTDYAAYETYKVVFTDTMSTGVVFESIESVKVGSVTLDASKYESTAVAGDTDKSWTLTIADLKTVSGVTLSAGTTVEVIYNAHLNEEAYVNAASGTTTNKNTVSLQYSNNPAVSGDGSTGHDNELGKTPEDTVYVFTYQVDATKIEKDNASVKLPNAKFQLVGADDQAVEVYKVEGVYYVYNADINTAYASVKTTDIVTDANGQFVIKGLDTGNYKLVETEAPSGYNKCENVDVIISAEHTEDADGLSATTTLSQDSALSYTIEDAKGSTLPTTGGMGTTILYIIGGILVIGAGVVLITKKRVENER